MLQNEINVIYCASGWFYYRKALHFTASNITEYLKQENNIKTNFQETCNVKGWLLAEFEGGRSFFCNLCRHVELGKITFFLITNLMLKILVHLHIIHLLKSSTCFEHYPAHLQEVYVVIAYMQPLVSSLCKTCVV